ncbi:MAG: GyrI-like domain-containing protein, partial [Candidatus Atribacteria bacterium]|nr:GyrI-like domain-containing protein [Candidatus Atribacteria bacterium]
MGLPLEQIALLLEEGLPLEQMKGILRRKQVELHQHLEEEQAKLERVATVRGVIPTYAHICDLFDELWSSLAPQRTSFTGPAMAIYYDPEYREHDVDAEVAVPIAGELTLKGRIKVSVIPEITQAACIIHHGGYETISSAYHHLMKWIEENGYHIVGPHREVYLQGPNDVKDPSGYGTEIQVPVAK